MVFQPMAELVLLDSNEAGQNMGHLNLQLNSLDKDRLDSQQNANN